MSEYFSTLSPEERSLLRKSPQPDWTAPMLATLTEDHFSHPDWLYERKLDGERTLAVRAGRRTRLLSRNRKEIADTYPEIAEAFAGQACDDFIVDGEIVTFVGDVTSFARLQQRMHTRDPERARASGITVYYYAFDILYLDGHDVTRLPLRTRKALLRRALTFGNRIRFTPHRNEDGEALLAQACRKGWEGLIAKRADSRYVHKRSRNWLKFKCVKTQSLVIGGFTAPKGARHGFGALLIGYFEDGKLRYAGRVGTGFDDATLARLRKRLDSLARANSPFSGSGVSGRGVTWVQPRMVCEVGYTEWTSDGRLRHPRFLGLRRDLSPKQVGKERPAS